MMKSKQFLRNSGKAALHFSPLFLIFLFLFFFGCQSKFEPTYKENDIPEIVKKICKDEFNLDVLTKRMPNALWVYAPVEKMLHEEKTLDEGMVSKLRNILTTLSRVLVNADKTPDFFALVVSDINIGLDYYLFANVNDIKGSYTGCIPWTEANRRYVIKFRANPEAVGDKTGTHIEIYNIGLPFFIAEQIAQRVALHFQEEELKKYFKVNTVDGTFSKDEFVFDYSIQELSQPGSKANVLKEMLNTIAYCVRTYDFKDFSKVQIKNLLTEDRLVYTQAEIFARPIP